MQYSAPNQTRLAGHESARGGRTRTAARHRAPTELHAGELAVKPYGTGTNRTSARASDAAARTARNSPAENRGFFPNRPLPDGPRRPWPASRPLPAADGPVLDNGMLAGGGAPSPCRLPGSFGLPAAATRASPLGGRLRYSTAKEDEGEKTTSHTPSTDRSAHDSAQVLAAAAKIDHAAPRTKGAPTPEGQAPAAEHPLRSGTLLNRYILLTISPSTLITHFPVFHLVLAVPRPPGSHSPRTAHSRLGSLAPKKWLPVTP